MTPRFLGLLLTALTLTAAPSGLAATVGEAKASWRGSGVEVAGGQEALYRRQRAIRLQVSLDRVAEPIDSRSEHAMLKAVWAETGNGIDWEDGDGGFDLDGRSLEPPGAISLKIIEEVLARAIADLFEDRSGPGPEVVYRRFEASDDGSTLAVVDLPRPRLAQAELEQLWSGATAWRGADGTSWVAIHAGELDPAFVRLAFAARFPFANGLHAGQLERDLLVFKSRDDWKHGAKSLEMAVALSERHECDFPPFDGIDLTLNSVKPGELQMYTAMPAGLADSYPSLTQLDQPVESRGAVARSIAMDGGPVLSLSAGGRDCQIAGLVPVSWVPRSSSPILLARRATATSLGDYLLVVMSGDGASLEPLPIDSAIWQFCRQARDGSLIFEDYTPATDLKTRWRRVPLPDQERGGGLLP